jgi:hypothetical protein
MGTLDVRASDTPLAREHRRLLETALRRGPALPEARIASLGLSRDYAPALLEAAVGFWQGRLRHEHHSSTVFSQLLPFLIAAEAPLDFKTCVLRMAMDELRHAGLCGAVVEALGGDPRVEADLVVGVLPTHADTTPAVAALRNVFFICCLNETVAISVLNHEAELATEPLVGLAVAQLAADESLHGRFGWQYLGHVWPGLSATERRDFQAYLGPAFAYLEAELFGDVDPARLAARPADHDLWALGVRDAASTWDLFQATFDEIIVPTLESYGLPARQAWEGHRTPRGE